MNEARTGFAALANGGRLAYRVSGARTAPSLLLLRPLGGSIALWTEFERPLAAAFQVVSYDPLGAGRSSDAPFSYTTRRMARDAIALLDQLDIGRCHVFGLSLGSMVASWLTIDFADRLERVVLASPPDRLRELSLQGLRETASLVRCLARPGIGAELCVVRRIQSPRFRALHPERTHAIEQAVRATPAKRRNLIALALAAERHDALVEHLPQDLEVLFLFGALDPLSQDHERLALLRHRRNCDVEIIADAGHDVSLEQPAATAARILAFLGHA